jgi:hypothetical protein
VAIVLCLPCLGLGYFWDDYYFLTSLGRWDPWTYLLPQTWDMFYRPIPQGLYFLLLRFADPSGGTLGHLLNLAVLAGVVALVVVLVSRLTSPRAGAISGLVLASYGLAPGLVAWISCSPDLFAMAFILAAFLLRQERKDAGALACATAAILCKEPAIAAFPILVLWDRLVGRPASRQKFQWIGYSAVFLAWLVVHPGIHILAGRGFQSGATGYVGAEHPERWGRYVLRYLLSLVNIPPPEFPAMWWSDRVSVGIAALILLIVGFLFLDRGRSHDRASTGLSLARVAWIAALLGVPTLLMPAILVRHWAPYFAFIPATALAIFLGPLLSRRPAILVVPVLSVFLLLGIRYRGLSTGEEPVWTELLFAESSDAIRMVRGNLKTIFPTFPKGTQVVMSVSSTGVRGIQSTLIGGQALSVWYRDPTLRTVSTLQRQPGAPVEYLVRVTSDLDVIAIDPETARIRTTSPYETGLDEIGRPIVNYSRAVAAGGDTDRAVRIAENLASMESGYGVDFNHRLSAMFLLAAGRREKAAPILARATAFSREDALAVVHRLLSEASTSESLDLAAFEAFGLSRTDPEAIRSVMRTFVREKAVGQAAWYAQALCRLLPGDPEGIGVIANAGRLGAKPSRMPPG